MAVARAGSHNAAFDEAAQVPVLVAHEQVELVFTAFDFQHVAEFEGKVVVAVHREEDLVVRAARLDAQARSGRQGQRREAAYSIRYR